MATNPLEPALKQARKLLKDAIEDRTALEQRIINLKQTIKGLSALCEPESHHDAVDVRGGRVTNAYMTSLTDAIRRVFLETKEPILTPPEVRDALLEMGVNIAKYKQPLVPIHNTLKRLESQQEIVEFRDDNGDLRGYRWVSPVARAVAEIDPIHQLARGARFRSPGASQNTRPWMSLIEASTED